MGHSITGLTIGAAQNSDTVYDGIGLFGMVYQESSIWDVNVLNVNISANEPKSSLAKVGALAGVVYGAKISGCSSTGIVSGSIFDYAGGGLIGLLSGGTVKDSCSDCTVSVASLQDRAQVSGGGLIGVSDNSSVFNCYAQGNVSANGNSGGLIGMAIGGSVKNCYSTADVNGTTAGFGFGGLLGHGENINVSNCYAAGSVSGNKDFLGSFIGDIYSITVEHSFCDRQSAGGTIIGGNPQLLVLDVKAVSTEYMKSGEFVGELNNAASKDGKLNKWLSDTEHINNSYPVLEGVWIPKAALTAIPASASVTINGAPVAFQAYNINDNNYFKLRDLAAALNGSGKQFEVGWDEVNNAIGLKSKTSYTVVGGELTVPQGNTAAAAALSTARVYLDGSEINLTAYNINDNNYFKLRDIAAALDFSVVWDEGAQTIGINTSIGYTE